MLDEQLHRTKDKKPKIKNPKRNGYLRRLDRVDSTDPCIILPNSY